VRPHPIHDAVIGSHHQAHQVRHDDADETDWAAQRNGRAGCQRRAEESQALCRHDVDTSNGRARAAPVTLDRISIGAITERSVPALIAQPGQLRTNLLGMSFLNRLESWEVRGDKLLMRGYP